VTRRARAVFAWAVAASIAGYAPTASALGLLAQMRGAGQHRQPPPRQSEPKPGPRPEDEEDRSPILRAEPAIAPPQDPLAISPEASAQIGSDWQQGPPSPEGPLRHTRWFPYYEERRGDYRLRLLPPLFVEQTR
jgi:hypothetical protein